jgi:hypothetical protein
VTTTHPTWLDLDALHLGEQDEAVSAHARGCGSCRAYLERLGQPGDAPPWLSALTHPAPRRSWVAVGAAAMVTVMAALVAGPLLRQEVRPKAAPAVAVYARHGSRVALWDGRSPFSPGDAVRFEVATEGFTYVTVAAASPAGLVRLYDGAPAAGSPLLPVSFTFDDSPDAEVAYVVFSRGRLEDAALREAMRLGRRDVQVWVTSLRFPRVAREEIP